MSTELKQAAQQALEALETCRIRSVSEWSVEDVTPKNITAAIAALRTAIQQAQQPATAIACGVPGMAKTTCPYCEQGFAFEYEQPVTGEPVQADSSEYLRVIASLGAALRRLSFAAQTTGGTAGPDAELQSAIGQAEQALSLGGIGQAMFATSEPVAWIEHHKGGDNLVWDDPGGRKSALYTHPSPGVLNDVVRDAISTVREQYRGTDWGKAAEGICDAIDAAILATTQTQKTDERDGWTDADADAARLALELECLLLDTKDTAAVSRWWASANEALGLHRARLAASQAKKEDA